MKTKTNIKIKMKKILIMLFLSLFIMLNNYYVLADDTNLETPEISSKAAFLIDNRTNKVLYSKNENQKMYPASTTKILTAIVVLENCDLNEVITVSYDAIASIPEGYTIANLQVDEELTVEQLLELLLVHSANDAANVLAIHVGGSITSFVSMMNTKVSDLGLTGSHFTNVYGLHDENHYTTAHDLAFIMKYCLKNESFRKIAGQASCAIPATNKYGTRKYNNTNELIIPKTASYYPYITAGKTGFTTPAGECLVSSAYKDDLELICVVLGGNNRFSDTRNLYEYAYSNYSIKNIVNEKDVVGNIDVSNASKETKNLDLLVAESIPALVTTSDNLESFKPSLTLNEEILAPIQEGDVLGKVTYSINGVDYTTDVIASHTVEESKVLSYVLYTGIILIFLFLVYEAFFKRKKKQR